MQYSEIIGVDKHFKSAFDITADVGDSWKTFISNDKFENNLNQIVNALTSPVFNKRNSIWIQGTYGTGKSHSLAVIKHLLCDDYNVIEDYLPKINKPQTRNSINNFRQEKRVFPIVLKGIHNITDVADLTYAIQQEVSNALKKEGIEISTKTDYESIQQILENGKLDTFFEELINNNEKLHSYAPNKKLLIKAMKEQDTTVLRIIIKELKAVGLVGYRAHNIVEWLKEVKEELVERKIADYLMIFWDEFTALLGISERRGILNVIQDIAELSKTETSDKTDTIGVYLLLVTHKRLEATETYKELKEDERNMAKARFIDLDYGMQPTTTYHILSGALVRKNQQKLNELIKENMTNVASVNEVVENIIDASAINASEVKDKLISLYPFHPYTSYLTTFVSRVVGDAERSVFEFLNNEDYGFKKFIINNIEDTKFLTADYVWDFFYKMFDSNSIGHFDIITNKFKLSKETVEEKGNKYTEIFKLILLLNILYRETTTDADTSESMVNPKTHNIVAAFSGRYKKEEVLEVLDYLDDAHIIHRSPDGVFEVASSSLPQKRLLEEKKTLYSTKEDISKIIEGYNMSCLGRLGSAIAGNIPRESEVRVFWGGEKEHLLRIKIGAKFEIDYAVRVALFLYRGETKELDAILNRKEMSKDESKEVLLKLSEEEEFKNIIFVSVDTELGNKRFEAYLDSLAQEAVARSLNMEEELQKGKSNAEKWIKQWISDIISAGYVDMIFRGDTLHIPFSQCHKHLQESYISAIFKYGLDYLGAPNTAWKKQNNKSVVEKVLKASQKTDLEADATGADAAIKCLLTNGVSIIFDESLSLVCGDENNSVVKLCNEISSKIDGLKNEPSINLGKEFHYLAKPEYGYYQNRLFMGAVALAFRPYIGKLYKSGNGQKVDKIVMKDIIVAMFEYWESNKFKDELIVRLSTEEERELTEDLNKIFDLKDKDGLLETKWAIRDKFKIKNKAPLWALKYLVEKPASYNEIIDKLFKFSKSTDEKIQQQFIVDLLEGIKTYKVELTQAISSVESEKCLDNYIIKELSAIEENSDSILAVKNYLNGVLGGEIVFWEERDVHDKILIWKIEKNKKDNDSISGSGNDTSNGSGEDAAEVKISSSNGTIGSYNNELEKYKKVRERVSKKLEESKENSNVLYKVIKKIVEKYDEVLYDLDQLL